MSLHFADVVRHLTSPIAMDRIGKLALKDEKFHFITFAKLYLTLENNEAYTNDPYGSCHGRMPT